MTDRRKLDILACAFFLTIAQAQASVLWWETNDDPEGIEVAITDEDGNVVTRWESETTYDVNGEGVTVTHEYQAEGIYYAIVAGVIEEISSFQTNGIVVWTKL